MLSLTPLDTFDIKPLLTSLPEAFILSKGLNVVNVCELHHIKFPDIILHEGDVEDHHSANRVGGELERNKIEVI